MDLPAIEWRGYIRKDEMKRLEEMEVEEGLQKTSSL